MPFSLTAEGLSQTPPEEEFVSYLNAQYGRRHQVARIRYRLLFVPLVGFWSPRDFMVRNLGGEAVRAND